MKKITIILIALSLVLAGCGKVHNPSSATQETEPHYQEAFTTATDYTMEASLINSQQADGKYMYTIFVGANDAFSTLQDNCVYYLTEEYEEIENVINGIKVQVLNVNETSTKDTAAFIRIESPQILDVKKLFVYALGTTQYEEGMTFNSVDDYREKYDTKTLVSVYLQVTERTFDMETLYNATRPVYESVRLVNLGSGYDVVFMSTKNTSSYIQEGTLWTPVDIVTFANKDYVENFADILNNAYVARGDVNGTYKDIIVSQDTTCSIEIREKNNNVEIGLTNYEAGDESPNCVVGNVVLKEGATTISDSEGQRAVIIFFN